VVHREVRPPARLAGVLAVALDRRDPAVGADRPGALAAVGRTYLSSGAGFVASATGWPLFFAICVVVAVPSLMLLAWLQQRGHFATLGPLRV
jgi:hypothetical protein